MDTADRPQRRIKCELPPELVEISREEATDKKPATKLCEAKVSGTYFIDGTAAFLNAGQHVRMRIDAYARCINKTEPNLGQPESSG